MSRAEERRQQKLAMKAAKKLAGGRKPVQSDNPAPEQQTLTTKQAIELAVRCQAAGDLAKAEGIYRHILQAEPNQPIALHFLGMISYQTGNHDTAEELISKALLVAPQYAEAHSTLGIVFKQQGKPDEAIASYRKAIEIKPGYAEAHSNLANVLIDLGKFDQAVESCRKALAIKPDLAETHSNLGLALQEMGKLAEAVDSCRKAIAIRPDFAEAHYNLGNALMDLREMDEAVASYNKALVINPDYIKAHNNLGNALLGLGRPDDAIASYQKAIAIEPDFAEGHYNLGAAFMELRKLDEAVASCQKAISIKPDYAEAHSKLGAAFKDLGQLDEAVASCQKALDINPDYAEAHSNLGAVLIELGRLDEALASCQKALDINPDNAQAWNNFTFAARVLRSSEPGGDLAGEAVSNGLGAATRATVEYAIHRSHLTRFRPHEADESFQNIIAALPPISEQTIPINGAGGGSDRLPDKMVALLQFGRSGTGLLHSLIDGHPEISTLPSVYLRGYFNQGIWENISVDGWRGLPQRFADQFAVLFDARSSKPIPSRLGEPAFSVGVSEGMASVGENRNEFLSVDREAFCAAATRLMEGMDSVDPMSFLMVVHAAFEEVTGSTGQPGTNKRLCFYHIHNPDGYAAPNFIRYAPDVRLLMTVREPIQNCESSIRVISDENDYNMRASRILGRLFEIDQVLFRMRPSVGVRLEDIKARPEATTQALCDWMGVEDSPTLYEMTAQGKKWWGDPTSPDYANDKQMSPFDDASTKRPVGAIFSEKDQFILGTLFYPFSVRFGYREADPDQFKKDLKEIRPMFDDMFDFEKTMAERSSIDNDKFRQNGAYRLLRAGMLERWNVLDELGEYPHMLEPLLIG